MNEQQVTDAIAGWEIINRTIAAARAEMRRIFVGEVLRVSRPVKLPRYDPDAPFDGSMIVSTYDAVPITPELAELIEGRRR